MAGGGQTILYLRALQGHSGPNSIDPTLQDNELIPNNFFEYIYHIGCAVSLHSITNSGLIAGGQNSSRERQTKFFTAVNPMNKNHMEPQELDLTPTRLALYKQKWKRHQDTVYWVVFQLAQRKGLKFYQTSSNAVILYDTLPAYCISKVVVMESGEIFYQKVYVSPRPPPKISYKDNWMKELDSEVAGSSKDTKRIQPKRTRITKEIEKGILFDHEDIKHSTRTERPVSQSVACGHLHMLKKIKQVRGDPVLVDQKEELDIDFRVPGLSHAVVKEAEHLRVQELVKKLENHPHREALYADLQQNNVHNPFSKKSKDLIRELGNVELFELCETIDQKYNVLIVSFFWNQGIVYCTCGQCLIDRESRRKFNKPRLDALSIPNYVIKKGRSHGARHCKTEEQKESAIQPGMRGRDAARKLTLKVDILQVFTIDFSEIQFIVNHNSQSDGHTKVQRVG